MFAAIMIKYVSGILLSALLILGFHLDSDTEKQTLRSAAVAAEKMCNYVFYQSAAHL